MYGSNHALRRPRRVSPLALRSAAAIIATAGLGLLAAACGGSNKVASVSSSSAGGPANATSSLQLESEYLRFARCMRSHGVSDFPDPITGTGGHPGFSLQGGSNSDLNSNKPAFQRGVGVCQQILGHRFKFVFTPSGLGKGA